MSAAATYVNPLAYAKVKAERIDQGVDYAGTGELVSIGPAVVTNVTGPGASGWPGAFVEYQLTAGPQAGEDVYYAEGVTPQVTVGEKLTAGQRVAALIPGWHSGIELGYGSGVGTSTYAAQHGRYTEGQQTAAGAAFSRFIASLGGPAGVSKPGSLVGQAPPLAPGGGGKVLGTIGAGGPANTITPFPSDLSKGADAVTGAITGAISSVFSGFLSWVEGNLLRGALFGVLVVGGIGLAVYGVTHTFRPREEVA